MMIENELNPDVFLVMRQNRYLKDCPVSELEALIKFLFAIFQQAMEVGGL